MAIGVASITLRAVRASGVRRTMRIAVLGLLLLAPRAWPQDDDALLETPPLGDGIPERVQELEREWAEDVGVKEPVDDPHDEPQDDVAEPSDAAHEDEPEPVRTEPADAARPERAPSALRNARDAGTPGRRKDAGGPADDTPAKSPGRAPSRAERRATEPED